MIAYPYDATKFTPNFTGISPHVTLMTEMDLLRHKFYALIAEIKGIMQAMMVYRGVGGSEYHTTNALETIEYSNIRMQTLLVRVSSSNCFACFIQ